MIDASETAIALPCDRRALCWEATRIQPFTADGFGNFFRDAVRAAGFEYPRMVCEGFRSTAANKEFDV